MFYLFNLLIIPLYYLVIRIISSSKHSANKLFFIAVSIHAILFRALANPYNYQEDTVLYAEGFRAISEMSFSEAVLSLNYYTHWGPLYLALNWVLSLFSSDPTILFVVVSVLTVGMTLWFYYKTSYSLLVSVLLYLMYPMMYIMSFGVLRQHLSIAIVLIALYKWNYSFNKLLLVIIIASLVHPSALILIPFLFVRNLNFQKINIAALLFYTIIGFIILRFLIILALPYFSKYQEIYNEGNASNNIVPVVLIGSMVIMYYLSGARLNISSDTDKSLFRFLIYGLIVSLFSIGVPGAGRLSLVFVYVLPTAISHITRYRKRKMAQISNLYLMGFFLLTFLMIYLASIGDGYYSKYSFIWNN